MSRAGGRGPGPHWAALAVLALSLLLGGGAWAQAPARNAEQVERRVQAISDQLRCPTCQDLSVWESEASFSVQIREKVRAMVQEGQSDDQILAYFVSRYGQWILRAPHKQGWGLVLWLLPGAAVLAVGALLLHRVWRSGRRGTAPLPVAALSPAQVERLNRDRALYEED